MECFTGSSDGRNVFRRGPKTYLQMMTRRVLHEVQDSCVNKSCVDKKSTKMAVEVDKEGKKLDSSIDIKDRRKENVKALRRSKRKNAGIENKSKKSSKEVNKKLEPKKTENKNSKAKVKQDVVEASPSSSIISEESVPAGMTTIFLNKSVSEDTALMMSDKPSETYWQELAEQRRIALEKALYENEMLHDQNLVLQTENSALKSALETAEKVLEMAGLLD